MHRKRLHSIRVQNRMFLIAVNLFPIRADATSVGSTMTSSTTATGFVNGKGIVLSRFDIWCSRNTVISHGAYQSERVFFECAVDQTMIGFMIFKQQSETEREEQIERQKIQSLKVVLYRDHEIRVYAHLLK